MFNSLSLNLKLFKSNVSKISKQLVVAAICWSCFSLTAVEAQSLSELDRDTCHRHSVVGSYHDGVAEAFGFADLRWTMGFFWQDDEQILMIDPSLGKLARLPFGGSVQKLQEPQTFNRPTRAFKASSTDHFVVDLTPDGGYQIHMKDLSGWSLYAEISAEQTVFGTDRTTRGIFGATALDSGLVYYADFSSHGAQRREGAFFYIGESDGSLEQVGPTIPDPIRTFFHYDFSYVTSLKDKVYILHPRESKEGFIWNISSLERGDDRFNTILSLEDYVVPNSMASLKAANSFMEALTQEIDVYQGIQDSKTVGGIYADQENQRLFLLTKEARSRFGETVWHLREIDLTQQTLGQPYLLPTQAAQITLDFRSGFLTILEEGPVDLRRLELPIAASARPPFRLYRSLGDLRILPTSWFQQSPNTAASACHELTR